MPELPPWLTQQADPAGAFLRGAQGGAAIAQVINQRNITQSNLRLNEQQAQMNHLKMEQAIKQRDRVIKGEFVLQALADQIEPLLAQGKPEMAMNVLLATGAREPSLFDTEGYPELLKHTDAAIKTEMTRKQLESLTNYRTSQTTRADKRISNEELRLQLQATGMGLREIDQMIKARELGYEISGQPDISNVKGEPGTPATSPGDVTLTPIARPLTPANVTAGQKDLMGVDAAISSIDKSTASLRQNPDAAGFEGYLKELYEGVGGQLGLKPGTRITGTRTQLRDTANQLLVGLRVESGQMSDWERKKLDAIADPLDITADADAIITRLEAIKPLIAARSLRLNKGLNVQPTTTVLSALSDSDLAKAAKAGYLTIEAARAEYQRRGRKP